MGKKSLFDKFIQKLTHSKDPSPRGLSHYPLMILGNGAGGVFSLHLTNVTHGHIPGIMVCDDRPTARYHLRPYMENNIVKEIDFSINGNILFWGLFEFWGLRVGKV